MIIIIFLKVQGAAENFQTAVSHVWSSHLSPDLRESDAMPGRGSGFPAFEESICVVTTGDGCPAPISGSCCGPHKIDLENNMSPVITSPRPVDSMFTLPQYHRTCDVPNLCPIATQWQTLMRSQYNLWGTGLKGRSNPGSILLGPEHWPFQFLGLSGLSHYFIFYSCLCRTLCLNK